MGPIFWDRTDAGIQLGEELAEDYANEPGVVVLALPRGGVPVAFEVARRLNAPLDIFLVRKLGVPGHEELAMGAIASGGIRAMNDDVVHAMDIPQSAIDAVAADEEAEIERRERAYREALPKQPIDGRTVILVDDGLATGATMYAAVLALRTMNPAKIVVAVPLAAVETCEAFLDRVEDVVCVETPKPFYGVGAWYEDFDQTSDDEVRKYLRRAAEELPATPRKPH